MKFAGSLAVGLVAVAALLAWRSRGGPWDGRRTVACVLAVAAPVLVVVCAAAPALGARLYRGWSVVGGAIGRVVSAVLLALLFVVVLAPFALIRLRDPLRLRRHAGAGTFWEKPRAPGATGLDEAAQPF